MVWSPSISTSGSTIGTSPASCDSAAKRASSSALAATHASLGMPSPMVMTARHLVNLAPSSTYSASRWRRPSSPSVTFSPGNPASATVPLSTLIPGAMPWRLSTSGKRVPSAARWRMVSSNRITPLMNRPALSVVNSSSRYARRFSSVEATSMDASRLVIVPVLSSAARMPFPGATSAWAMTSSWLWPIAGSSCSLADPSLTLRAVGLPRQGSRVPDSVLVDGVAGQVGGGLRAAAHPQLAQHAGHVVLDGLLRQAQLLPDLPVGQPVGDQLQDPLLLRAQPGQPLVPQQMLARPQPLQHPGGHRRVQQAVPGRHRAHRAQQVGGVDLLEHIAGRARQDRGEQRLVVGKRGQHQHLDVGVGGADLTGGLDAAAVGQPHVHDDHLRQRPVRLVDRLTHRGRLGAHDHVLGALQQRPDPVADDVVVVDQHHPGRPPTRLLGWLLACHHRPPLTLRAAHPPGCRPPGWRSTGMATRTVVPSPVVLTISARPPSRAARARRFPSPRPAPAAAAVSNPRPSSSTSSHTAPSS